MSHYICTGECKGESENTGVCSDPSCSHHGKLLEVCNCPDGIHAEIKLRNVGNTNL